KMGALRGVVATDGTSAEQLVLEARQLPTMAGLELASRVTCEKSYPWTRGSIDLAATSWQESATRHNASSAETETHKPGRPGKNGETGKRGETDENKNAARHR